MTERTEAMTQALEPYEKAMGVTLTGREPGWDTAWLLGETCLRVEHPALASSGYVAWRYKAEQAYAMVVDYRPAMVYLAHAVSGGRGSKLTGLLLEEYSEVEEQVGTLPLFLYDPEWEVGIPDSEDRPYDIAKRCMAAVACSDLVIVDSELPSFGVGMEVLAARRRDIPVILVCGRQYVPTGVSSMLRAVANLTVCGQGAWGFAINLLHGLINEYSKGSPVETPPVVRSLGFDGHVGSAITKLLGNE